MKLGADNKRATSRETSNEFSSILDESPWERFMERVKPLLKLTTVLIILGGLIYGGIILFGHKSLEGNSQSVVDVSNNTDKLKLSQCVADATRAYPVPNTDDSQFYPKLITGYDKQLACYDQYPSVDQYGKTKIEDLRKTAIDSSGAYKDSYLANGGSYDYTSSASHKDAATGCSYNLSESEYIKCTDEYKAAHPNSTSTMTSRPPTSNTTAPSSNQNNSTTPPAPTNSGKTSTTDQDRQYWLIRCPEQVRQQYGGSGLTQDQRDKAIQQCYSEHGI